MKAVLFVGPSATGKTFVAEMLLKQYPDAFELSKLFTTRKPRTGDKATDRIFLSKKEFQHKVENGDFLAYGEFGGNYYGYTKESLVPRHKNLIVSTWPEFLPNLVSFRDIIVVGLQAPKDWEQLLTDRLKARGETPETTKKRLELIAGDIQLTKQHRRLIESRGKFFIVSDDNTIPKLVIPWLREVLELKP